MMNNARNEVESAEKYYQLIFIKIMILMIELLLTKVKIIN